MQDHKFILKPSKFYCTFLAVALLASFLVIILIHANIWIKLLVAVLLGFYGSYTYLRYALLKTHDSIIALQYTSSGKWQVTTNAGVASGEVKGDSVVTPFLSILRFNVERKRSSLSCIILRDSLDNDDYRRLVALLRMQD